MMGFFSGVCSFVSGACSAIGGAISSIGEAAANIATDIASLGIVLAEKVGEAIKNVAISLGILKPEEKLDELGEKAMISDKKPEDFDSINEYIDHLRHDVVLDKEMFDKLDDKELLARSAIGASITLKGINEKLDSAITPAFMAEVAKQELAADEIVGIIKSYKENNLKTDDYALYLNNELSIDESDKNSDALISAYQKLEPELTIDQIEDKVMDLKG